MDGINWDAVAEDIPVPDLDEDDLDRASKYLESIWTSWQTAPVYENHAPDAIHCMAGESAQLNFLGKEHAGTREMAFSYHAAKLLGLNIELKENEEMVFHYSPDGEIEQVIERTNNVLTRAEALQHEQDCKNAILAELGRWHAHGAWRRRPRQSANNLLTSRWVLKWKIIDGERRIKARLTVQGFKDRQEVDNFSATTSRWAQRLILIIAAQFGWDIGSADVSEAFLRGLTFEELAKQPGEVKRSVQLELPPGSAPFMQQFDGMKDFNPITEVLDMVKPGYGLKDAPRLWNMALRRVLQEFSMRPVLADKELYVLHRDGQLVLILSTHVDDLKMTGTSEAMKALIAALEKAFDKLKVEWNKFEHCGIMHEQDEKTKEVTVHQNHYVKQLRPMKDDHVRHMDPLAEVDERTKTVYMSLLGGVAWVVQTRPDVGVYVSSLQRHLQNPRATDVLNLNRVLRYLKRHPLSITYRRVDKPWRLAVISDSAFQSKDQDCLALRSGIIALTSVDTTGKVQVQPIEYLCKKQQHVCRSTYAAELHSALDLTSLALLINTAITEILCGVMSASEMVITLDSGKLTIPVDLYIDARAVFDSVTAKHVKTPADKILLIHALSLREHLTRRRVNRLLWIDTRDMVRDALNKGKIDRGPLRELFEKGIWSIVHEQKAWSADVN